MSTNDEISKVEVTKPAVVDVQNTEVTSSTITTAEPGMAEYAKMREAEVRGEKYEPPVNTEAAPAAATDESAAATEAEKAKAAEKTDVDPLTQIDEKHPAKGKIAKRMGELTAEREAEKAKAVEASVRAEKAERDAHAAQEELAKLRQEAEARATSLLKAEDDKVPNRENFEDPDEYNMAVAQYAARHELRKANEQASLAIKNREEAAKADAEKARVESTNNEIINLHKKFNERIVTAKTDIPDFDEKVTNNKDLIVRNETFFAVENSDFGPQMLYHLASNPEALKEIEALLPATPGHVLPPKFLMRLGVLEEQLRVAGKPKPSKAAAPIKPVLSRQSPERKTPEEESTEEYASRVNKEESQARAARRARY